MTQAERDEIKKQLYKYDNVGDMIKFLYMTYDCSKPVNVIHKNMIINGLVTSVSLLNLKKFE